MPVTYEKIATTTLSSSAASITFSSISGSYTDLVLITTLKMVSGNPETKIRFNSDTASNYSYTILSGTGTVAESTRFSSVSNINISYYGVPNATANSSVQITNIQNYSNTTTFKTTLARANQVAFGVDAIVGLWRNTSAITSITVLPNSGSYAAGSIATLYGILKAV